MQLYYSPGACSLAPHIVLHELGLPFQAVKADTKTKQTPDGTDYWTINNKGQVPALRLDSGDVLTEGPVISQYLADQKPESKLAPAAGTMERYRLQEWLNFITSEMHKGIGGLFNPKLTDDMKVIMRGNMDRHLNWLEKKLAGRSDFLMGGFTIADAYLFTVLNWTKFVGIDLSKWPALQAYHGRVAARPAVQATLKAEGLIK